MDRIKKECKKARQLFSPYFDRSLSTGRASKLEEHFSICSSCKTSYDSFASILRSTRALPPVRTSSDFEARLFARIREEGRAPARASWWQDFARVPISLPVGAAALVLIAVFSYTKLAGDRPATGPDTGAVAGRPSASDTARTRTNTRPDFLGDFEPEREIGLTAGADLVGPPFPFPMEGRQTIAVFTAPRDLSGVPIEGPYEHAPVLEPARPSRGPAADSAGRVDTPAQR